MTHRADHLPAGGRERLRKCHKCEAEAARAPARATQPAEADAGRAAARAAQPAEARRSGRPPAADAVTGIGIARTILDDRLPLRARWAVGESQASSASTSVREVLDTPTHKQAGRQLPRACRNYHTTNRG